MMQSPAAYKKAIIILIDGARSDLLAKEMTLGRLPNLSKLAEKGTHQAMLTCFPSTTGPAYLPYLTGCFPGRANVPGIRWFDKSVYAQTGWGFKSFRSYCGFETRFFDADLNHSLPTAWQSFDHPINILGGVTPGLKKNNDLTKRGRSLYYFFGHITNRWGCLDQLAKNKMVHAIHTSLFDFAFVVFPAIDEYAHRNSPTAPITMRTYQEFDGHLGDIVTALTDTGQMDDTLIFVVSDHGLSETHTHFDVGPWLEQEKKCRTFYYSNIFKFGFDAATMVSGNGMCHIYLKGQNGWGYRVTHEELAKTSSLVRELSERPEVAVVVTQARDHSLHLTTKRGHSHFVVDPAQQTIQYRFDANDPLGIFGNNDPAIQNPMTFDQSLELTWNSLFPDIFVQMHQLFSSPRTGDIVISAHEGFDLRKKFEHPLHKASHGAISPLHMRVPLISNHPFHTTHIRSVDIFPTLLRLTGKEIPKNIDGRCLAN